MATQTLPLSTRPRWLGITQPGGRGNVSINSKCFLYGDAFMSIPRRIDNQAAKLGSTISGGTGNSITGATGARSWEGTATRWRCD